MSNPSSSKHDLSDAPYKIHKYTSRIIDTLDKLGCYYVHLPRVSNAADKILKINADLMDARQTLETLLNIEGTDGPGAHAVDEKSRSISSPDTLWQRLEMASQDYTYYKGLLDTDNKLELIQSREARMVFEKITVLLKTANHIRRDVSRTSANAIRRGQPVAKDLPLPVPPLPCPNLMPRVARQKLCQMSIANASQQSGRTHHESILADSVST